MENMKQSCAVSFDIILDETEVKPEPERMALMKNRRKTPITAQEIEKRQKLAEQRRQAKIEARLKRMHEREEVTRKLACSVDVLLQQQSLRAGQINPNEVPRMSQREVLKTANDVVKEFNEMRRQLLNMDLKVDEGRQQTYQMPETKWHKALKSSKMPKNMTAKSKLSTVIKPLSSDISPAGACAQKQQGVAFEIPVNDFGSSKKCKKKPAIASLQTKELKRDNQQMVALKVEEKHRKAAERRQKKLEDRVRKTRESREALMELQTKVNIFRQHQAALDGKADPGMMLSNEEAFRLAQDIADGFSTIHSKYEKDLERAKGFFMVYQKTLL